VGDDYVLRQQHARLHSGSGMNAVKWILIGAVVVFGVLIYLSYMVTMG
jgi:hypothetical protein